MKRKVEWQVKKSPEAESVFDRLGPKMNDSTGPTKKTLTVNLDGKHKKRRVVEEYASCNMTFGALYDSKFLEEEGYHCYMAGGDNAETEQDPPEYNWESGNEESDSVQTRARAKKERAKKTSQDADQVQPDKTVKSAAAKKIIYEGETSKTNQEANNQEIDGNTDMAYREAMRMTLEYRTKYEQRELEVHELRKQNEVMMTMINDLQRQVALQNKEKTVLQKGPVLQIEPQNETNREPLVQYVGKEKMVPQSQIPGAANRKSVSFTWPEEEEIEYVPQNVQRQSRVTADSIPMGSQEMTEKRIQELINQQLKKTGIKTSKKVFRNQGRPYPAYYDQIPYPAGYSMPTFMKFSGEGTTGNNLSQHIAHFRAACGNTGGDNVFCCDNFHKV